MTEENPYNLWQDSSKTVPATSDGAPIGYVEMNQSPRWRSGRIKVVPRPLINRMKLVKGG